MFLFLRFSVLFCLMLLNTLLYTFISFITIIVNHFVPECSSKLKLREVWAYVKADINLRWCYMM